MPNSNTPKNELEQQYEREYRRIIQAANRQRKLGYYIPPAVLPIKPSKVKNITPQDVERMIELTPQKIRKSSIFIDTESGEAFEGLDVVNSNHKAKPSTAKVRENSTEKINSPKPKNPKQYTSPTTTQKTKSKKKRKENAPPKENNLNMQIVDTINNMLDNWTPAPYWHASFLQRKTENYHKIQALWRETLETEGEYEVAYRLENNATELLRLLERLLYSSDSTVEDDFNLGRFVELLIGRALTAIESDAYNESAREAAIEALRGENSVG